jgi:protein-tyrosine phosphatase
VNTGPLAEVVISAARGLGIALEPPYRSPRAATDVHFRAASRIIALDRSEHEPLVCERFTPFADAVAYWQVKDVGFASPQVALPAIRRAVVELASALANGA